MGGTMTYRLDQTKRHEILKVEKSSTMIEMIIFADKSLMLSIYLLIRY